MFIIFIVFRSNKCIVNFYNGMLLIKMVYRGKKKENKSLRIW